MKSKKSLLSVLLAALLLATCVAGMLIFSAGAQEGESPATHVYIVRGNSQDPTKSTWTDEDEEADTENLVFQTVIGAMYHAQQQGVWANGTSLEIQLDVPTFTVEQRKANNLIFTSAIQAPRREDGSVLPVTITKHENQEGPVTIQWKTCGWLYNGANLTFKNLILDFSPGGNPQICCGGRLEFNDVEIKVDETASGTPFMQASAFTPGCFPFTFTNKAEYKKLADEDERYTAEIVFSGNTVVPEKMEIRGAGRANTDTKYIPSTITFSDGSTLARTKIGGKIVVKDEAVIKGSIKGFVYNHFGFSTIELLGGTVKGSVTGVGCAITSSRKTEIILAGTTVEQEILGNGGYSMAAGCKSTVLYRSGSALKGIKGAANASAISGTVEVIIEGDCSQKVYGFGGSTDTQILNGGKVNLIVNSGTVTGAFRLNSDNQYVVQAGGEAAAYFNGGTVDFNNYSVLSGAGKTVNSGFQDGSVLRVEWNGTNFVDHGATETDNNFIYPIYGATLACDVHFTVTKLNAPREKMFIRYLNATIVNGDVYLTLDTTKDGAAGPSDEVPEGQAIFIGGWFQDYSTQVNGNSYTKINGGDSESITIANLTVQAGEVVDNDIYNCVITNEFGINRSGDGTSSRIVNDFKNVDASTAMVICAAQHYYAYPVTEAVTSSFENCKIKQLYADIYTLGTTVTEEEITASFSANLKGCQIGSIEGALGRAEITLEGHNVISGRIVKKSLFLETDSYTEISGDCILLADEAGTNVTVHKADPWDSFDTVYVSAPAYSDITVTDAEENRAPYIIEEKYEVRGWYPTVYATFILEDRIYVKLSVDPAVAESFAKEAVGVPFEVIYRDEDGNELKRFTLEQLGAEGGYLLAADGAGEFDHILYYALNGEEIFTTTLVEMAESGKTYYDQQKLTEIANLFSAIASYGKAALNTSFDFDVNDLLAIQRYGNNEVNIDPEQFSVSRESQTIDFVSIHLLMGDTVGLRLKVSEATQEALQGAKLYLVDAGGNRNALAADRYIKNKDSLDIFIHAKDYETFAHLIVTDKNDVVCLDLNASVSYLMYEMVKGNVTAPTDPSTTTLQNTQLRATALFIVRTNEYLDYLAEQNYQHPTPPEMDQEYSYVGYARRDITPSYAIMIYNGKAYTARDAMMITCTAVSDGENIALIMSADLKGIEQGVADAAIQQIENEYGKYGISRERIIISATHTHSAPTIDTSSGQAKWRSYFYSQTLKAVGEALSDLAPVEKALAGKGYTENVNFVRRFLLQSGNYQTNASTTQADKPIAHESEADNEVRVIRFVREGKKDVLIMNFQTHYGLYEQTYSADFIYLLRKWAEQDEDLHFAYYSGASGNLNMTPKFSGESVHNKYDNDFSKGDTAYGRVEEMWRVAKAALDEATEIEMGKVVGATRLYLAEIGYESDELVAAATVLYAFGSGSDEETISAKSAKLAEQLENFEGTDADKAILQQNGMSYRWAQGVERRARLRTEFGTHQPIPFTAIAFGKIAFTSSPIEQFDANAKWVRENSPFYSASNYSTEKNAYVVTPDEDDIQRQNDAYAVTNFNSKGDLFFGGETLEDQGFVNATGGYEDGMTFTMSLANGSCGYVPTAFAFPHGTYEVLVCRYVAGSGEEFALAQLDLLNRCYNAQQQ